MRDLTASEREVVAHLAAAWNAFLALPRLHPDELTEFRHGVHALQNSVMGRPALGEV